MRREMKFIVKPWHQIAKERGYRISKSYVWRIFQDAGYMRVMLKKKTPSYAKNKNGNSNSCWAVASRQY